jgi:uncharacterized YkwD family protein
LLFDPNPSANLAGHKKERKELNRFKKLVLTGTLAVSSLIGAGVVSAAPNTASDQNTVWALLQQNGISLSSLMNSKPQFADQSNFWQGIILNIPEFNGSNGLPLVGTNTGKNAVTDTGTNTATNTGKNASTDTGTNTATNTGKNASTDTGTNTATNTGTYASQVINLVNQERAKAGLQALSSDNALSAMALDKAKDMYNNHYFDHTSPTYGSPFEMMNTYGISYTYAGENIAMGQQSPQEVMNAWMNSTGHRQNILSPNYTKIGVAFYNGEWVQEFIAS